MNKLSYTILAGIIVLIFAIGATYYFQNKNDNPVTEVSYTNSSISFPSAENGVIVANNFLNNPSVTPDDINPGNFYVGNTFTSDSSGGDSPSYVISYDKTGGYFNIALLKKPLGLSRSAAEEYLMSVLGIDTSSMCGLSYSVTVPGYVDEEASGIDYRFGFCPGSTPL